MNELAQKYPNQIASIMAKYPADQKRASVMALIYLAQMDRGYVTKRDMEEIGEIAGISATDVASLIGFYTLYHDVPGGKHRFQVCTDLACGLRGADEFLAKLCQNLGIRVGETTPDGLIEIEEVTCLAGCNRAPMFQVQSGDDIAYYENQTVESALDLIETLRRQEIEAQKKEAG